MVINVDTLNNSCIKQETECYELDQVDCKDSESIINKQCSLNGSICRDFNPADTSEKTSTYTTCVDLTKEQCGTLTPTNGDKCRYTRNNSCIKQETKCQELDQVDCKDSESIINKQCSLNTSNICEDSKPNINNNKPKTDDTKPVTKPLISADNVINSDNSYFLLENFKKYITTENDIDYTKVKELINNKLLDKIFSFKANGLEQTNKILEILNNNKETANLLSDYINNNSNDITKIITQYSLDDSANIMNSSYTSLLLLNNFPDHVDKKNSLSTSLTDKLNLDFKRLHNLVTMFNSEYANKNAKLLISVVISNIANKKDGPSLIGFLQKEKLYNDTKTIIEYYVQNSTNIYAKKTIQELLDNYFKN